MSLLIHLMVKELGGFTRSVRWSACVRRIQLLACLWKITVKCCILTDKRNESLIISCLGSNLMSTVHQIKALHLCKVCLLKLNVPVLASVRFTIFILLQVNGLLRHRECSSSTLHISYYVFHVVFLLALEISSANTIRYVKILGVVKIITPAPV